MGGGELTYGLGVDLGTSFVGGAVGARGRSRPLVLGQHSALTPAVVRIAADGSTRAGAGNDGADGEPRVARNVKRRLGDPNSLVVAGQPHSAVSLLAVLLRSVVRSATEQEGEPPAHVALTYPAVWGPYRREQFEEVARIAGVGRASLVTEPEAVALRHGAHSGRRPGELVAVYDLGGGTFDSAVVRVTDVGAEVVGDPEGLDWVGGIDFDEAVLSWVDRELDGAVTELGAGHVAAERRAALLRLRRECVRVKEELSFEDSATLVATLPTRPGRPVELRLTRAEYEEMIRPSVEATVDTLRRTIASAGVEPVDLAGILLAGGSSPTPLVSELLAAHFPCPLLREPHPKLSVALGAALVAGERTAPLPAVLPAVLPDPETNPAQAPAAPGPATTTDDEEADMRRWRMLAGVLGVAGLVTGLVAGLAAGVGIGRSSAPEPTVRAAAPATNPATAVQAVNTWVQVVNVSSAKCMATVVDGQSDWANGTLAPRVVQRTCAGVPGEQWRFEPGPDGTYRIAGRDGLVWTAAGPGGNGPGDDGVLVVLRKWTGALTQQWTPVPVSDGHEVVMVRSSGKCLDVAAASTRDGTEVQQWACDETLGQSFTRMPV